MKVRTSGFIIAIALVFAMTTQAQIVGDMTPDRIREAIVLGTGSKQLEPYKIQEKARWSWPPLIAFYTTPFLRVALAANAAKKRYQPFKEADVTPEMIAPEIQVYAPSHSLEGAAVANVVAIIVLPYKSQDTSQAVHPTRTIEASEEYKNLFGFSGEGSGIVAAFPLEAWTEKNEVHVVFDRAIPNSNPLGSGGLGGCTDCKSRIYLEKVR